MVMIITAALWFIEGFWVLGIIITCMIILNPYVRTTVICSYFSSTDVIGSCTCSSLNRLGPHRLICLNVGPMGSGTIRPCWSWCDLVGKVCHGEGRHRLWGLLLAQAVPKADDGFLLAACRGQYPQMLSDQDVKLSVPPVPCLPACCHVPHHEDYGLNLWNYKPAPIKCFLL